MAHVHDQDAVLTAQKDNIIRQLAQANYESKHDLESLLDSTTCNSRVKVATSRPLASDFNTFTLVTTTSCWVALSYEHSTLYLFGVE